MLAAPAVDAAPQVVTVVAAAPLPGLGLPLQELPANVQLWRGAELDRQRPATVAGFLGQNAASVGLGDAQGNPWQPEFSFRGFHASPLLGTPQGVSVFFDGVRVNEPFGDIVNWDLIPGAALAGLQLMPGSNPVFGLNTLGGALVITPADGRELPGMRATVSGGAFGRRSAALLNGTQHGAWDTLLSAQATRERGWRDHGSSRVAQLYGRLGWHQRDDEAHASLMLADNRLEGAQTLPQSWLAQPSQAYTWPDTTTNRLAMLTLGGTRRLDARHQLSISAYLRRYRSGNVSSNVNGEFGEVDPDTGVVDTLQATNEATRVRQGSGGLALQLSADRRHAGVGHRWTLGLSVDASRARYVQQSQAAAFTADRGTVGTGGFTPATDAASRSVSLGLYALDAVALSPAWTLSLSARHDRTRVAIDDRSGTAPGLDGRHSFSRLNPAFGLDWQPGPAWTVFASASQGFRAPTPMELTCADPGAPCKLPTGFVSDPPLRAVVARTLEAGARGQQGVLQWSVAAWRTQVRDDIQFVASDTASAGYFRNVGATRRQGLELGARLTQGQFTASLRLARVDARFDSGFIERSPFHPAADAQGLVSVPAGARLPGIARHSARLRLDWKASDRWSWGAGLSAASASLARGDESNQAGSKIAGHGLIDLDGRCQLAPALSLEMRLRNLLDRRYASAGVLGRNAFTGPSQGFDGAHGRNEVFLSPGAPFAAWLGLEIRWD